MLTEWPKGTTWIMLHGGVYYALRGSRAAAVQVWQEALDQRRALVDFYTMDADENGGPDTATYKVTTIRTDYILSIGET